MSEDLTACWHGASWRDYPAPIVGTRPDQSNTLQAATSRQTRGKILTVLRASWMSPKAVAEQARISPTTAQLYLGKLAQEGEVERVAIGRCSRGDQLLYRRNQ